MLEKRRIRRRDFLAQTSAAGALGVSGWVGIPRQTAASNVEPCSYLDHDDFRELMGDEFVVTGLSNGQAPVRARLQLTEMSIHRHPSDANRPVHVRKTGFSLVFFARDGAKLSQESYKIDHRRLGRFDVFLVPLPPNDRDGRSCYIAVLN